METGKPLEKAPALALLDRFFAERVAACPPVEGAAAALEELSARAEIVVLTNVPIHARAADRIAPTSSGSHTWYTKRCCIRSQGRPWALWIL